MPEIHSIKHKPKHRAGRPVGSKNKKAIEKEAKMAELGVVPVKQKRGRPLGSKDKQPRTRRWRKKPIAD